MRLRGRAHNRHADAADGHRDFGERTEAADSRAVERKVDRIGGGAEADGSGHVLLRRRIVTEDANRSLLAAGIDAHACDGPHAHAGCVRGEQAGRDRPDSDIGPRRTSARSLNREGGGTGGNTAGNQQVDLRGRSVKQRAGLGGARTVLDLHGGAAERGGQRGGGGGGGTRRHARAEDGHDRAGSARARGEARAVHESVGVLFNRPLGREIAPHQARIIRRVALHFEYRIQILVGGIEPHRLALRQRPGLHHRIHVLPHQVSRARHFFQQSQRRVADQSVAVGLALGTAHVRRVQQLVPGVGPGECLGPERRAGCKRIVAAGIHRQDEFVHGSIVAAGTVDAVVEDQHVAGVRIALGNPLRVVLLVEHLVGVLARAVEQRVTPAIEQVAALGVLPAGVARCLSAGGGVVDDPELAAAANAEHDLVDVRVIVYRVHMVPERRDELRVGAVGVDQFGMGGGSGVVVLGGIVVLHQVVPDVPLPNHHTAAGEDWLDLHHTVGLDVAVAAGLQHVGAEARRRHIRGRLEFGHQGDDVAVGQHFEIVVHDVGGGRILEGPQHVARPVVLAYAPAFAAAKREEPIAEQGVRAQQVAVGHQEGATPGLGVTAVPRVDHLAVVVDQIGHSVVQRRHQNVSGGGLRRVVQEQTDGLVLAGCGWRQAAIKTHDRREQDLNRHTFTNNVSGARCRLLLLPRYLSLMAVAGFDGLGRQIPLLSKASTGIGSRYSRPPCREGSRTAHPGSRSSQPGRRSPGSCSVPHRKGSRPC